MPDTIVAEKLEHEARARAKAVVALLQEAKPASLTTRRELFGLAIKQALSVVAILESLLRGGRKTA